jgi:predicted transcriptional regulator
MSKQINIQVSAERKAEWKDLAEKEDRTMTSLIRTAVEHYKATEGGRNSSSSGMDQATQSTIEGMKDTIERLEDSINTVQKDTEILRSRSMDDPELREMSSQILTLLPDSKREATMTEHTATGDFSEVDESNPTVSDLAQEVGSSEERTQEALLRLQGMNLLGQTEHEGQTFYYKEG